MRALALLLLMAFPMIASAQAPPEPPIIRTSLDPTDGIVIGQPVHLNVAVLFPGEMPHPPLVSVPEAAGAQILRFERQAVTIRDRIDGRDYIGQSFEFIVFPRRGGEIAVPAPAISLLARNGDPAGSTAGTAMRFGVSVPAGIDPSGPVLVADSVSASESWSPQPDGRRFRIGDAVTRTVRRQAAGVPALSMAEFRFEAPDGVRAYVDPPVIEDRSNRGGVDGQRTDKVTYVFEKPGHYELPALIQPWWSLAAKQARTETLAGLTVTVAAAAAAVQSSRSGWLASAPWLLAGALLILMLLLSRERLRRIWGGIVERRRSSERFARRRLMRTAKAGDPKAAYHALASWRACLPASGRAALDQDQALGGRLADLKKNLFGESRSWGRQSGAELARAIAASPLAGLSRQGGSSSLPPLNPSARVSTARPARASADSLRSAR
jgi:hypothetical protein